MLSSRHPFRAPVRALLRCIGVLPALLPGILVAGLLAHYDGEESAGPLVDQTGGETAAEAGTGHLYHQASAPAGTYGAITLTQSLGKAVGIAGGANGSWNLSPADSTELGNLVNNFTVMSWVHLPEGGLGDDWPRTIGDNAAWDGDGWNLGIRNKAGILNTVALTGNGIAAFYSTAGVVTAGAWQHLAATKSDTTGVTFYLNGVQVGNDASASALGDFVASDDIWGLGNANNDAPDSNIHGMLVDEVRVYDTVLDAAGIVAAAESGQVAPPPPGAPVFTSQPVSKPAAVRDLPYTGQSLSGDVADSDTQPGGLTFAMLSGPSWLTIAPDGTLSGTPGMTDLGPNSWTVTVDDGTHSDSAQLLITVSDGFDDLDADGDGLPDDWELTHGLDPADDGWLDPANGSWGDPDGDGRSTYLELLAGLDPRRPDRIALSIDARVRSVDFTVPAAADTGLAGYSRDYQLQFSPDLVDWSTVVAEGIADGAPRSHPLPAGQQEGFFRLALRVPGLPEPESHFGPHPGRLATTAAPGWGVTIRLSDGTYQEFSATDAEPQTVEAPGGRTGDTAFVWNGLGSGVAADLTVRMTRSLRESGAAWRLVVENTGEAALWEVTFPDFRTRVHGGDMLVLPTVCGRLHPASQSLAYASSGTGNYPSGLLSMQCAGFYGDTGGVYVAVHDPDGSGKRLEMNNAGGTLAVRWHWPAPDMGTPGTGWEMPGEVLVRPFEGDWFDLAQIYRAWAAESAGWWPRGAQAGRPDTPDWFKDTPVWIMSNGPWPYRDPPIPIDQAVAKIKHFAEFMGDLPCAVHWYNWHQIGFDDNYPHYFPADAGFAEGVAEVQAAGVRVMPYINAHLWDTDLADFQTTARPAAVKSFNGSIPTKSYNGNTFAPMCPATPLWQATIRDLVLQLAGPDYGVNGVYLDQVSAQAAMQCFDPAHGHPLGGGGWWTTQGYWPMLDDIRQSSPGTILTSESNAEPYANRLDGYLTWVSYREGNKAIPLFHAVYAGQVQLFGRLYKWDSWKGVAMRAKTAQALVWGEQLGWIIPDVVDDPVAGPFLRRLARIRYELRRYLARGRMARPPQLTTDGTTLTSNWVFTSDLYVTTPTVLSGAWQRDDGRAVALILVNADDQPHTVTLPFEAARHGLAGDLAAREWTGEEDGQTTPVAQPVAPSWTREITLAPMAALAIEIEQVDY